MHIAKAIGELRKARGISQEELAAALFVSRDLVSKWETGARRPDWQTIEKLAAFFGVPTDEIVDKDELVYAELEKCLPENAELTAAELTGLLNAFLYGLDETEANLFICRYHFFESIADIAASFRLKENRVRSTLSRTRKKLKKFIKEATNAQFRNV